MIPEPEHLDFPFYAFSNEVPADMDMSFSYHVVFHEGNARAICNDIPCNCCPFICKDGIKRQEELVAYARTYHPEHLV